jgi:hypothetical protein
MRIVVFFALLLAAGCASTNQSMSAEQINAATKDKSASCVYAKVVTMWGTAETIVMGYDQRTISNGGIIVGDKCSSLDAKDMKPAPPAAPPVATPKP